MRHLPVLVNILSLVVGAACLVKLILAFQAERDAKRLSHLAFFASYSYLMIVAAFFSYCFINIDAGEAIQQIFAGLVFFGMAMIELSLPWMVFSQRGVRFSRFAVLAMIAAAVLTALQAPLLWFILSPSFDWWSLVIAFGLFLAIQAWVISGGFRNRGEFRSPGKVKTPDPDRWIFLLYLPIAALGTWEATVIFRPGQSGDYVILCLPLAYMLTSIQFLRDRTRPAEPVRADAPLELPAAVVAAKELTAREVEMARYILRGASNKEIAAELTLSGNTVRNHIYSLYQKLGIQRRMDLLALLRNGEEPSGTKIPGGKPPI